jgi:hypothetical protein
MAEHPYQSAVIGRSLKLKRRAQSLFVSTALSFSME